MSCDCLTPHSFSYDTQREVLFCYLSTNSQMNELLDEVLVCECQFSLHVSFSCEEEEKEEEETVGPLFCFHPLRPLNWGGGGKKPHFIFLCIFVNLHVCFLLFLLVYVFCR